MFNRNYIIKDKVTTLKERSDRVFDIFTKTVQDLSSLNSEIVDEIEEREAQIKILQQEQTSLDVTKLRNDKMISKINSFINE